MTRQRIYNPAHLSPAELKATFVARQDTLSELIRVISEEDSDSPRQHMLLIGPRGIGKTMLGLRFLQAVTETPGIAEHWQPVAFHEENYEICSIADFWLSALQHLTRVTGDPRWQLAAIDLARNESSIESRAVYAFARLAEFSRVHEKKVLLFIENLDEIFEQIGDEQQIHALRATLIEHSTVLLVGTATSIFEKITDYEEPFYEFFRLFLLEGLKQEDTRKILETFTSAENIPSMLRGIRNDYGRIETIRRLTNGNPRLLVLACRLLVESPYCSALEDVQRLIDEQTPYFKSQIEKLPKQARKVFHFLATGWKPMLAREVATDAKLTSAHCSAQLKQLVRRGYAREIQLPHESRMRYEVIERFYNIYYLLRYSPTDYTRFESIVSFLEELFGVALFKDFYQSYLEKTQQYINNISPEYFDIVANRFVAQKEFNLHGKSPQNTNILAAKTSGNRIESTTIIRTDPVEESLRYARLGDEFLIKNRVQSAENSYRISVSMDECNGHAWASLALILQLQGHDDYALDASKNAYNCSREYETQESLSRVVLPLIVTSCVMLFRKRYRDAETILRNAIDLAPRNSDAWRFLAKTIFTQNEITRFPEAEEAARKAVELSATPSAILMLATILAERGDWDEALGLIKRATLDHPQPVNVLGAIDLTDALLRATASGYGQQVKRLMERAGLTSQLEPVWCAVRENLGEDLGPLPVELLEAVQVVKERLEQRAWDEPFRATSYYSVPSDLEDSP